MGRKEKDHRWVVGVLLLAAAVLFACWKSIYLYDTLYQVPTYQQLEKAVEKSGQSMCLPEASLLPEGEVGYWIYSSGHTRLHKAEGYCISVVSSGSVYSISCVPAAHSEDGNSDLSMDQLRIMENTSGVPVRIVEFVYLGHEYDIGYSGTGLSAQNDSYLLKIAGSILAAE